MRPVVIAALAVFLVGAVVAFAADGLPNRTSNDPQYWVEMDNAFGMQLGGDLKIAGVRAGKVTNVDLDKKTLTAHIGFRITQNGFGDLRKDAHCESRPQSLIGEYFLDCDPGTSPVKLKKGATIPISQTSSTVPPDLVNDVLRKPQSERLSLILDFFGAGLAGNGRNLNDTIRRGVPALRETDRVLAILAQQRQVISNLNLHADAVLQALANDRQDVSDWVTKARNISADSAQRRADIARGFHDLPTFVHELKITLGKLGQTADAQSPALATLDQNAGQLKRFFTNLTPFANASRPAFKALGQASQTGSKALPAATPVVQELNTFAKGTPELGKNLAAVLQHLDDRKYAAEYDTRAAQQQGVKGPSGYSGLEALLQYVLDQATSTNLYDANVHILNVLGFESPVCAPYADGETLKAKANAKDILAQCQAKLGPSAPGIDTPDSTVADAPPRKVTPALALPAGQTRALKRSDNLHVPPKAPQPQTPSAPQAPAGTPTTPALPSVPKPNVPTPPSGSGPLGLPNPSDVLPGGRGPSVPAPPVDAAQSSGPDSRTQTDLLNYLLK